MSIKCPHCQVDTHQVKVSSHYGRDLVIDQCFKCGSLWFDKMELFEAKHGQAGKVERLNKTKLLAKTKLKASNLLCPHDGSRLKLFSDPNFPKSIQVESCPQCGGFWFNRGEFMSYQKFRQKNTATQKKEEPAFNKQLESLLATESSQDKYNTVGRLGQFLMQDGNASQAASWQGGDFSKVMAVIVNLIYFLLRLFVFKNP